ncbi:hypothetical protein J4207_05030 [Candidatus Woesearchaeota archaeon]|nr:hypothetical protein [Candidatus Woesearchaeota archaeon]
MTNVFEIKDVSGRIIHMTSERWKHILKHPEMQQRMQHIIDVLTKPQKIINVKTDVKFYYGYDKHRKSPAKYLRVIVKYLNCKGYIITSYFVENL